MKFNLQDLHKPLLPPKPIYHITIGKQEGKKKNLYLICCDNCFNVLENETQKQPNKKKKKKLAKLIWSKLIKFNTKLNMKQEIHLQIKNNNFFSTKNGWRVWKQRIKNSKISGVNLNPAHNSILVCIQYRTLPIVV